jgi:hypothetical protein
MATPDFRSFTPKGEARPFEQTPFQQRWWMMRGEEHQAEVANSIGMLIKRLQDRQAGRIRQLISSARLYGGLSLSGIAGIPRAQLRDMPPITRERISDNVVRSVIDTASARIAENKPRPYYLTSGGSYKLQRKAKKLNSLTEGIFFETKTYELGGGAQRDAEIFGDGFIHVLERNGRICHERVLGAELWVDEEEAAYGNPRQMHWLRLVDRDCLLAMVKEWADGKELQRIEEAVREASSVRERMGGPTNDDSNMVEVRESWHLRSSEDSEDGAHCISVENALIDPVQDWPHDFFPFARFQWGPRPRGYWSQGIAEQLMSKQVEINKLLSTIQRSMHMVGQPIWMLEAGSKVVKEHISNEIAAQVVYKGTKPEIYVGQPIHPDYFQHYKDLRLSCYEEVGISLQSATGQKPAGLNSGEAQRVYRDTVAERMKTQERLNERAYMDLAAMDIAIAREIAGPKGYYEAKAPSGHAMQAIRMTAEELNPDEWSLQCFPTSSLPRDPAGRLQTIQEYIQAGFMTPRQGRRALDFPDLEAVESLANAAEDLLSKILDEICDEGEYTPPEPTDDLHLSKELVIEYINRGRAQDLEDDRLDMLRTWNTQVDALIQAATPPPPPMPQAGQGPGIGPPQAAAMPPPQSGLIPNVPMAA